MPEVLSTAGSGLSANAAEPERIFKTWMCLICGWIYDELLGAPDEGIAPMTHWADVPDTWLCPECGVAKRDFDMVEV